MYAQYKATYADLLSSVGLFGEGFSVKSIKQTVRDNIRRLRTAAGLSQQKLAERTGKSLRYINYLENTDSNVTIEVLEAVAKGIGVSVATLVSDPSASVDPDLPKDAEPGLRYLMSIIAGKLGVPSTELAGTQRPQPKKKNAREKKKPK